MKKTLAGLLALLAVVLAIYAWRMGRPRTSPKRETFAIAFESAKKPGIDWDDAGFELQVYYRIRAAYLFKYKYQPSDAKEWKSLLKDKKAGLYARLCAAFFLLDDNDKDARAFVEEQLRSTNLRHRFNAAKVVEMFANGSTGDAEEWSGKLLIRLLEDRSLEGELPVILPNGDFPEGDLEDIRLPPIRDICDRLGYMKEKRAVPVLMSFVKRRFNAADAAFALGHIGDQQAGPILIELLNSREQLSNEHLVIIAIGELKYQPGAAVLATRLRVPPDTYLDSTGAILNALLDIGDRSVIGDIEKYLEGDIPNGSRSSARRVLVQLKEPDPVPELLKMFEQESDKSQKGHILSDLGRYKNPTVVAKLTQVAANSESAFLRRGAILGLESVGNRQALLALAGLLDTEFPPNLKAERGWKIPPKDWQEYFRERLAKCLNQATKQEFGADSRMWQQWIEMNVKE